MKRILVISHVLPFPGQSGQEQRVRHSLEALRKNFHITFLTFAHPANIEQVSSKVSPFCDELVCLGSKYSQDHKRRALHKGVGTFVSISSSLRLSNYIVGQVEFTARRIQQALDWTRFDAVLYEYWHAYKSTSVFRQRDIPCILDMHNLLWLSFEQQQEQIKYLPPFLKRYRTKKYKAAEESAWQNFDGIIAINREEESRVRTHVDGKAKVFLAPMGVDLESWPYLWRPDTGKVRIAYYGGLASSHNQHSALECYTEIMPHVWKKFPDAELWVIGSNPPESIKALPTRDRRVKVTGFVTDVKSVLADMSVVVCPWKGTYGFRSRLIEVIGLGIPLISTPDAVHGMQLEHDREMLLGSNNDELAAHVLTLLEDPARAVRLSLSGRKTVEQLYSSGATYDKLALDLDAWLDLRKASTHVRALNCMNIAKQRPSEFA